MPLSYKRSRESPSDSADAVVMHFDVAAASPKPGPTPASEQTSSAPEARGSSAAGPARGSPQRDESTKTKDFCKVRVVLSMTHCAAVRWDGVQLLRVALKAERQRQACPIPNIGSAQAHDMLAAYMVCMACGEHRWCEFT